MEISQWLISDFMAVLICLYKLILGKYPILKIEMKLEDKHIKYMYVRLNILGSQNFTWRNGYSTIAY